MEKTGSSWVVWASAEMNQKLAHLRQGLHPYISLLFYSLGAGERVEEKVSWWIAVASAALERGGHLPSAGQDSCGKRRPWVWGSTLDLGGRSSTSKWRSCRKVLVWAKSPVLWLRDLTGWGKGVHSPSEDPDACFPCLRTCRLTGMSRNFS